MIVISIGCGRQRVLYGMTIELRVAGAKHGMEEDGYELAKEYTHLFQA